MSEKNFKTESTKKLNYILGANTDIYTRSYGPEVCAPGLNPNIKDRCCGN